MLAMELILWKKTHCSDAIRSSHIVLFSRAQGLKLTDLAPISPDIIDFNEIATIVADFYCLKLNDDPF